MSTLLMDQRQRSISDERWGCDSALLEVILYYEYFRGEGRYIGIRIK